MNIYLASICSLFLLTDSALESATLSAKLRTDGTQLREAFGEMAGEVARERFLRESAALRALIRRHSSCNLDTGP